MQDLDYKWIIDSQYNIVSGLPVCRAINGKRHHTGSDTFIFSAVNYDGRDTAYVYTYTNAITGTKRLYFDANFNLTKVETQGHKYISERYLRYYAPLTDYIREHLLPFLVA